MFDPFEQGRHIYTFENRCIEDCDIRLHDGTTKIFLNPFGTISDVSKEMDEFLKFIAGKNVNNRFTDAIQKEVNKARKNQEWRVEYMTLHMRDMENREIGRAIQLVELIDNLTLTVGECEQACKMCKINISDYEEAKELIMNYNE